MLLSKTKRGPNRFSVDRPRGYTMVEVIVAGAVAAAGFAALTQLQTTSLSSVRHAWDTSLALTTGEHFVEMVRARSMLCEIPDGSPNCLFVPPAADFTGVWEVFLPNHAPPGILPTAPSVLDAAELGDFDYGLSREFPGGRERRFCIHWRSAWIVEERLMRLDVRVLWPKADTRNDLFDACSLDFIPVDPDAPLGANLMAVTATLPRGG